MSFCTRIVYGVDLSDAYAAVVRAARSGGAMSFSTLLAEQDGPRPEKRRALGAEAGLAASRRQALVAAAVPVRDSVTRWLTAPFASPARARKVLPSLLDVQIPFPLEQCASTFLDVHPTGDCRVEALAVAAPRAAVERCLAACAEAAFDPLILDHEGLALWTQALDEAPPAPGGADGLCVVAYAGLDRTVLAAGRGRVFAAAYASRWGRNPAAGGGSEDLRAFAERAVRVLRTHGDEGATVPVRWQWTGPAALDEAHLQAAEAALASAGPIRFEHLPDPAPFLARALAARALRGGARAVNLRTGDLIPAEVARWSRTAVLRASAACLALGALLGGLALGWLWMLDRRDRALQAELRRAALEVGRLSSVQKGQELRMARDAVARRNEAGAPLRALLDPSASSLLAALLRLGAARDFHFEAMDLAPAAVQVRGVAPDREAGAQVDELLTTQGWKTDLQREAADTNGQVRFTLKGVRP